MRTRTFPGLVLALALLVASNGAICTLPSVQPTTPAESPAQTLPPPTPAVSAPSPSPTRKPTGSAPVPSPAPDARLQPSDLVYLGAFRLPDTADDLGWTWSGHALAYYPDGDPAGPADGTPGSLFGTGNDQKQWVAEIGIPVPVRSRNINDLNTATTLQEFHNIRGTLFDHLEGFDDFAGSLPKAGLAYLPPQGQQTTGKLYFAWGYHIQQVPQVSDESLHGQPDVSHGWCELDLSNPQPAGAWVVGDHINFVTSDYLFPMDPAWAAAYTPGKLLATGRFRDGGQGGRGPSLLAIGPWNHGNPLTRTGPPPPGAQIAATPLLLYTNILAEDDHTLAGYSHADEWMGGAWLTAGSKSAVVFVGTKGLGNTWYGFTDGTVWPQEAPFPEPGPGERGWWADRFVGQMLFYDPADLAAVARGEKQPWEPQPYATLDIDPYLYHVTSARQWHHVSDAAFDRARGLLYVLEPLADEEKPLVHVWKAGGGS